MAIAMAATLLTDKGAAAQDIPVDLELILAVDISLSMDEDEQRLQRDGYVPRFAVLRFLKRSSPAKTVELP